jgi:hypothetical protein
MSSPERTGAAASPNPAEGWGGCSIMPDTHGFWHQVFNSLGLPRAMFWLDQEMSVP